MYKVILVDDERMIVEGLRRVVKWADYGCEVVGTAENAVDASALIREKRPDILFTDIRMPGQNGLNMLAGLKSEFPDMQVAVLTGFREFSYAQEAIRLGVCRFLLKPSKMDEINEALDAMTARLRPKLAEDTDDTRDNAQSFIVKRALAFMEENYAQKLTLQEVADKCYVSQWHLSKLLNRYGKDSFYGMLNAIRMRRAKELLADPKYNIGEVAYAVGYADTAHFARVFKKLVGVSANEYRNRLT